MSDMKHSGGARRDVSKAAIPGGAPFGARRPLAIDAKVPSVPRHQAIDTESNLLLNGLSSIDLKLVKRYGERVAMVAGQILNDAGQDSRYLYFPGSGSIALTVALADGLTVEVGSVGRNGMTGLAAAEFEARQTNRAIVKLAGCAYRVKCSVWQREFINNRPLQRALMAFNQGLISQLTQIAACNGHHSVQQRLTRWLLTTFDHAYPSMVLPVTQEFIATLLGVRREGITAAAGKLQAHGVIHYVRGMVTLSDRAGLEHLACECYDAIKDSVRAGPTGDASTSPAGVGACQTAAHLRRYTN